MQCFWMNVVIAGASARDGLGVKRIATETQRHRGQLVQVNRLCQVGLCASVSLWLIILGGFSTWLGMGWKPMLRALTPYPARASFLCPSRSCPFPDQAAGASRRRG